MNKIVDKSSSDPLYKQLASEFLNRIDEGLWRAGDKLPSEKELMDEFGVGRVTIRTALDLLVKDGHITKHQGKGTFVSVSKAFFPASGDIGFTRTCALTGKKAESIVLEAGLLIPPLSVRRFFHLQEFETAVKIHRLRLVDGVPTVLEETFLPIKYKEVLNGDLTNSVTESFIKVYGNIYGTNQRTVEAYSATQDECRMLEIKSGNSMLMIRDMQLDKEDEPLSMTKQIFNTDRFKIYL